MPKRLWERQHICPSCGLSMDRDLNAAINILEKATVGMAGSNACVGEQRSSTAKGSKPLDGDVSKETSMKQEAHIPRCG